MTAATAAVACAAPQAVAAAADSPATVRGPDPAVDLVEVSPRRAEPGTVVRVRVEVCEVDRRALATSVAFEADVRLERGADGSFHGSARISVDAEPGTYGVTVACGVDARAGHQSSFRVVPGEGVREPRGRPDDGADRWDAGREDHRDPDGHDGGYPGHDGRDEPRPPHASPVAPVRAGGGGTAGGDADGTAAAQRVGLAMAGGAAAAGAVVWGVRRRSRARAGG
ncbi:hypothetical protein [Streptomyces sp. TR06-5]|uniref:hypothetical protein n=1 Tax=unclassified Streptomyces TaxID=2593676 RepID=UPI0039A021B0